MIGKRTENLLSRLDREGAAGIARGVLLRGPRRLPTILGTTRSRFSVLLFLMFTASSPSYADTLYDGGLGTFPAQQGWLYLTDPLPPQVFPEMC